MKTRPILFSGAMVRAILDGRKTQTRRLVKPQPVVNLQKASGAEAWQCENADHTWNVWKCPCGQPGDRLWVRETWKTAKQLDSKAPSVFSKWPVKYLADGAVESCGGYPADTDGKTRVSIHMPRWASRITLEITGVRVERLNDISEADAEAEGIDFIRHIPDADETLSAKQLYDALWESINGQGSWVENPWVWVVEFKVAK